MKHGEQNRTFEWICLKRPSNACFCPCGKLFQGWRSEHNIEVTEQCKKTHFPSTESFISHCISTKDTCHYHYAMFEVILHLYPCQLQKTLRDKHIKTRPKHINNSKKIFSKQYVSYKSSKVPFLTNFEKFSITR